MQFKDQTPAIAHDVDALHHVLFFLHTRYVPVLVFMTLPLSEYNSAVRTNSRAPAPPSAP